MAGNVTCWPVANFSPYPHVSVACALRVDVVNVQLPGEQTLERAHRGRRRRRLVKVPITETPVLPVLKPSVWAPIDALA